MKGTILFFEIYYYFIVQFSYFALYSGKWRVCERSAIFPKYTVQNI